MKRLLVPVSLLATCALFSACEPTRQTHPPKPNVGLHTPPPTIHVDPDPSNPANTPPAKPPEVEPIVKNPVPDPTKVAGEVLYGKPVPGKPGFVTSPHSNAGYIDVRGFPPGTEVKDPYSGKTFLVP